MATDELISTTMDGGGSYSHSLAVTTVVGLLGLRRASSRRRREALPAGRTEQLVAPAEYVSVTEGTTDLLDRKPEAGAEPVPLRSRRGTGDAG